MVQASGAEAGLHAAEHETDGRDEPSRGGVRAVERAVRILRAFTPERPWLTLAEIAEAAVVDKATARRMLLTLIGMDLVEQEPIGQRYALGLGVVALGASVPVTVDLRNVAAPHLARCSPPTASSASTTRSSTCSSTTSHQWRPCSRMGRAVADSSASRCCSSLQWSTPLSCCRASYISPG